LKVTTYTGSAPRAEQRKKEGDKIHETPTKKKQKQKPRIYVIWKSRNTKISKKLDSGLARRKKSLYLKLRVNNGEAVVK